MRFFFKVHNIILIFVCWFFFSFSFFFFLKNEFVRFIRLFCWCLSIIVAFVTMYAIFSCFCDHSVVFSRCMLGNLSWFFCRLLFFSKSSFGKISFRNTTRISNSLDLDQARHFVGPDLDPNCLQRSSAYAKFGASRQRVSDESDRVVEREIIHVYFLYKMWFMLLFFQQKLQFITCIYMW